MKVSFLFVLLSIGSFGQNNFEKAKDNQSGIFSIWAFKQKKNEVNGLSIGVAAFADDEEKRNVTGLKIEVIGMGILLPLIPKSPIVENDSLLKSIKKNDIQHINGLSLSGSGSICNCFINGFSTGLIGQLNYKVNGLSVSAAMNFAQIHNGLQAAMFTESFKTNGLQTGISNGSYNLNGAQIGLLNSSNDLKGLQLGLINKSRSHLGIQLGLFNFTSKINGLQLGFWNVNTKRSLPFFNF
jgi:hypothetical protein